MAGGGQGTGNPGGGNTATILGIIGAIIAIASWLGIHNFHDLKQALNNSGTQPTPSVSPLTQPVPTVNPQPTQDPECTQALNTSDSGVRTLNSTMDLPSPASIPEIQAAFQSASAEASTVSSDLTNEADEATDPTVQAGIRNLATDWASFASSLTPNTDTNSALNQILADYKSLAADCGGS